MTVEKEDQQEPMSLLILGDERAGKTSILMRHTKNTFTEEYKSTNGLECLDLRNDPFLNAIVYSCRNMRDFIGATEAQSESISDSVQVQVPHIGFAGAAVVIDITDPKAYSTAYAAISLLRALNYQKRILLVGNKLDRRYQRQVVATDLHFPSETHSITYIDVSARDNINIELMMSELAAIGRSNTLAGPWEELRRSLQLNVLVAGCYGVGKTTWIGRNVDKKFVNDPNITWGVDFRIIRVCNSKLAMKVLLWDSQASREIRRLTSAYYRGAQVILFMFDTTNAESFVYVETQIRDALAVYPTVYKPLFVLVGNKIDLQPQRTVTYEAAYEMATRYNAVYVEASSKAKWMIDELVDLVLSAYINCLPQFTTLD